MKKEYRITKLEKGQFFVEYKEYKWGSWKLIDKVFKSLSKAQEFVAKQELKEEQI